MNDESFLQFPRRAVHLGPGGPPVADLEYNLSRRMEPTRGEVTILLEELRSGQQDAEPRLLSLVYLELKRLARSYLRRERPDHSLAVTELVHEVYLRLAGTDQNWKNRAHFFAVAAQAMRRVLVDHARAHRAKKRGSGKANLSLDEGVFLTPERCEYLLEVDEALEKLRTIDPRQARVVELRFFGDLSIEEAAEVLHCSTRTVKRDWRFAQAWLRRALSTNADLCNQSDGNESTPSST